MRQRWKLLIVETWRALAELATLAKYQDLFCWECNAVKAVRVSKFAGLRNMQARLRSVQCPKCKEALLWPHDMRLIRRTIPGLMQ